MSQIQSLELQILDHSRVIDNIARQLEEEANPDTEWRRSAATALTQYRRERRKMAKQLEALKALDGKPAHREKVVQLLLLVAVQSRKFVNTPSDEDLRANLKSQLDQLEELVPRLRQQGTTFSPSEL